MSARAAKILMAFFLLFWGVAFYYGFFLGLIVAILITIAVCECLKELGLLPPKSTAEGEELKS